MEDKMYRSVDDNRYASRYEYSNLSSKDVEVDQNYGDYPAEEGEEYPIGDSQDIDQSALPGDYYAEDEYCNYSVTKSFLQPTRPSKGAVPKYGSSGYGARGALQNKPSAYYEVGDYRRAAIRDKLTYYKAEPKAYVQQQAPDYALPKVRREALMRNLTEKEYRNRLQKMVREDRMKQQERYAAASAKYYGQETEGPMTHEELLENFKKNYKMDLRKPPQPMAQKHHPAPTKSSNTKKAASPKSDTEALRGHYEDAYERFYAGLNEKALGAPGGTKDTRSEPVQPDYSKFDKFLKPSKRRTYKEYSPRRPLTADDFAHEMLRNSVQKSHDLELKYKNDAYGKLTQEDTDAALQDINENMNQQSSVTTFSHIKSSEEKVIPPRKNVSKIRTSLRSSRSKKSSNNTGRSKKYEDIVKLQKSKCTIMSVIYDGIQKCEQAKYEIPQMRAFKGESYLARATKESQTGQNEKSQGSCTSNELMNSEIITNMFKEFRDYHLQNISQEVKRIQYLDVLPQKLNNFQGPQ